MYVVVMPKLGFNMDEGKLTVWYKKEGDSIKKGEPLFAIETDKTAIDVEATQDGVVRKLFVSEGTLVPVTLPIAIIADAGEDISAAEAEAKALLGGVSSVPAQVSDSEDSAEAAASADGATASSSAGKAVASDSSYDFDVFIIGGGPGGYVAAIRAAQLGLRVAIAEKDAFGGVCLNRGCIPTKTFLRSVEVLKDVKKAAEFGIKGHDVSGAKLDMKKVQERKKSITEGLVKGVGGLLAKNKVTTLKGEAKIIDKNTIEVNSKKYTTANLIIATGTDVQLPKDVLKTDTYLTSDDILNMTKLPKDIVIIGGGVIGVEFAYFFASAGIKTTVVEFQDRLLPMSDKDISEQVEKTLKEMGASIHTSAKVTSVTKSSVEFEENGKKTSLDTKNVLVAIGRIPVVTEDVLAIGVKTENGAIVTDESLRTNIEGVYAIGDVNGKVMLAHKASAEGIVAVETIAGHDVKMDYFAIPNVIYIKPEIATVGYTEETARAKYGDVKVGKFPIMANGKAHVYGDSRGMIKIIAEPEFGEIVGAHLYCASASEMIAEMVVAMRGEMTMEEVARSVHPHPTIAESVHEAFLAALNGSPIHF